MNIFRAADILLPVNADFSKWSVVACDQYTSEPSYWEKAEKIAAGSPSTLNIIFPEAYLGKCDEEKRISDINETMLKYEREGIFKEYKNSMIYVERRQANGKVRHAVIGAVDLEAYDFNAGSQSPIRATEGTILSRIPPRKKIRKDAPLELPHIIMLVDDRKHRIIEPLTEQKDSFEKLYDFDLMLGGGHITGRLLDAEAVKNVLNGIDALADTEEYESKYGKTDGGMLIAAVGDGNHSLATAKACWDEIKENLSAEERENHPARFALAELMNIHDEALEFEAIERVMFDVEPDEVLKALYEFYPETSETDNGGKKVTAVYGTTEKTLYIKGSQSNLAVGTIQRFIDEYIKIHGGSVDYIHGADVTRSLASEPHRIGFIVDKMSKNELFETVIKDGALPRKTFSMGEAHDKRYYLEAKRIK